MDPFIFTVKRSNDMPYVNKPRPYKKEYEQYDGTPAVKKKRAQRNKARRIMEQAGLVQKGDGKDVDHKVPLSKGGKTVRSNLAVKTAENNRSYPRNSDHSVKTKHGNRK
jgi:5-methylcytosine-specific restriction endonuclease McrA